MNVHIDKTRNDKLALAVNDSGNGRQHRPTLFLSRVRYEAILDEYQGVWNRRCSCPIDESGSDNSNLSRRWRRVLTS